MVKNRNELKRANREHAKKIVTQNDMNILYKDEVLE
jgi:hypothetical protein